MTLVPDVALRIIAGDGRSNGDVIIATLPGAQTGLWDYRTESVPDESVEPVQIIEGQEYRFHFRTDVAGEHVITTDRPEIFARDQKSGISGRVRPGLYTGKMPISVQVNGRDIGSFAIEVRSRKLNYLTDYRWMLRDIADIATELVMERFAPSEQQFSPDVTRDSPTVYQRFAFLNSLLSDESFEAAIHRILAQPYVSWDTAEYERRPGRGWPGGSLASRLLSKSGRRTGAPALKGKLGEFGVPARLRVSVTESSIDNLPNQFVKFALLHWRELASQVAELSENGQGAAAERGKREAESLRDKLDALLSEELFREVGDLTRIPTNDQVIQKREGYRDIFRLHVLSEVAAQLSWAGGEDVYGAGQKNVATLYEYWAFLQLARVVADECESAFDWGDLVHVSRDAMDLDLRYGKASRFCGSVSRLGRTLKLELWFNRTFGKRNGVAASWSRPMRPDCSLLISPVCYSGHSVEPVWLHFDAKYRVDSLREIMTPTFETIEQEINFVDRRSDAERRGDARTDDLAKMHTYRDALRRSAGAYILYPGESGELSQEYHELLPGLGAFALKPAHTDQSDGLPLLRKFLSDVIDHVSLQTSQHERSRFWLKQSFAGNWSLPRQPHVVEYLTRPPADVRVLLGFVRHQAHLDWIHLRRRYNLRADNRTGSVGLRSDSLATDLVVLYAPSLELVEVWTTIGEPGIATRDQMIDLGYPDPRGSLYFCLPLGENLTDTNTNILTLELVLSARQRIAPDITRGSPVSTSWKDLVG